ncbi:YkyA family protein [Oceanobacillus bengalensis]|uniref:Cell-wall binding lipoprotein n=1 Tax=Oceanobacillus bengalensis TaxID=1435466 RepID=A0A494Z1K7_9BACI|nr:YkyA family protein [Oceanobacillus bengalensis]RKQ16357.1 hypothetical protein D8M05_07710 [Oceanobacillus bengalensis]
MSIKKISVLLSIWLLMFLVACSGETTEEQIHTHLEEAVKLEEDFENKQSEITQLELEEQEIYGQIIELGTEDINQIIELSKKAIEIIDERSALISKEKESVEASKNEFNKVEDLIPELDKETKESARKLVDVMGSRYNSYDNLYEAYTLSLELEEELYNMLQREDLEQEELTEHINRINDSYQQVLDANEEFNGYTVEYNNLKEAFYQEADINITYAEE